MAPLKPENVAGIAGISEGYPWLRGHGSIEALVLAVIVGLWAAYVSMAERSWLH